MSTNGKQPQTPEQQDAFLITESSGGPHTMVERVLTVQSLKLPGTRIAEVERIQISEQVIPLPSANPTKAA